MYLLLPKKNQSTVGKYLPTSTINTNQMQIDIPFVPWIRHEFCFQSDRYYYLRDTLEIDDEAELRIKLASLMIAAQVVGATISVSFPNPTGRGLESRDFGESPDD